MNNFQVRLTDTQYDVLQELAEQRETTITNIIRGSIEIYYEIHKGILNGDKFYMKSKEGKLTEIKIIGL